MPRTCAATVKAAAAIGVLAGTAVAGALWTRLVVDRLPGDGFEWPRIETDAEIGVVGCSRPLEDAVRIAAHGPVRWVAAFCRLSTLDAYQVVSQACRLRIGNLVNPLYSVAAFVRKDRLPGRPVLFVEVNKELRNVVWAIVSAREIDWCARRGSI